MSGFASSVTTRVLVPSLPVSTTTHQNGLALQDVKPLIATYLETRDAVRCLTLNREWYQDLQLGLWQELSLRDHSLKREGLSYPIEQHLLQSSISKIAKGLFTREKLPRGIRNVHVSQNGKVYLSHRDGSFAIWNYAGGVWDKKHVAAIEGTTLLGTDAEGRYYKYNHGNNPSITIWEYCGGKECCVGTLSGSGRELGVEEEFLVSHLGQRILLAYGVSFPTENKYRVETWDCKPNRHWVRLHKWYSTKEPFAIDGNLVLCKSSKVITVYTHKENTPKWDYFLKIEMQGREKVVGRPYYAHGKLWFVKGVEAQLEMETWNVYKRSKLENVRLSSASCMALYPFSDTNMGVLEQSALVLYPKNQPHRVFEYPFSLNERRVAYEYSFFAMRSRPLGITKLPDDRLLLKWRCLEDYEQWDEFIIIDPHLYPEGQGLWEIARRFEEHYNAFARATTRLEMEAYYQFGLLSNQSKNAIYRQLFQLKASAALSHFDFGELLFGSPDPDFREGVTSNLPFFLDTCVNFMRTQKGLESFVSSGQVFRLDQILQQLQSWFQTLSDENKRKAKEICNIHLHGELLFRGVRHQMYEIGVTHLERAQAIKGYLIARGESLKDIAYGLKRRPGTENNQTFDYLHFQWQHVPEATRNAIYGSMYAVITNRLNPEQRQHLRAGEMAFLNREGFTATNDERAQAIEMHLSKK